MSWLYESLVLTVTIEPDSIAAGQALTAWQSEPAALARRLEAAIGDALTDLAISQGARLAALAWAVRVEP